MKVLYRIARHILRQLTLKKVLMVSAYTLRHPLFSMLAFYATVQSFIIAKKYFPTTNSADGIGNAFRHALWTSLILAYCCKISSFKKSVVYCKRITDMHEEIFPNPPAQNKMDLHNNHVGIRIFEQMLHGVHRQFFEKGFLIDAILEKTKTAQVLTELDLDYGDDLIYMK